MTDTLPPPPPDPDDGPPPAPRKLSPALIRAASALLQTGLPELQAAKRLLVGRRTWLRWKALGRQYPDGIYGTFRLTVTVARESFYEHACKCVYYAMSTDGRLALAVLERRRPKDWGVYRGELGELKRRVKEMEAEVEKVKREAAGQEAV